MKTLLLLISSTFMASAVVPVVSLNAPASGGSGSSQIFTFYVADSLGVNDINWFNAAFGNQGANSCMLQWNPGNYFQLFGNDGSSQTGGYQQTNAILSNSQCSMRLQTSYQTFVGNTRVIVVDISFAASYGGSRPIWAVAGGSQGNSGWQQVGTWTTGGPVTPPVVTLTSPASGGAGENQIFTVNVKDAAGGTGDISWLDWAAGNQGANSCMVEWHSGGWLSLYNDAGVAGASYLIGSGINLENSQCILHVGASTNTYSGDTIIFALSITFKFPYNGFKTMWGVAGGSAGTNGWVNLGTWDVSSVVFSAITPTDVTLQDPLNDDYDGGVVTRPSSLHPWSVRLKSGAVVKIPSADNFIQKTFEYHYEPSGDSTIYHYVMDTTPNIWMWRLGDENEMDFARAPGTQMLVTPKGWSPEPDGSAPLEESADRSENAEFSFISKWKPGPMLMFIEDTNGKIIMPLFPDTSSNERLGRVGIFTNSQRNWVIGPAIKPDITSDEFKGLITRWVYNNKLVFLKPLLEDKTLDDLKPGDAFETEIVRCLRNVTPKAN